MDLAVDQLFVFGREHNVDLFNGNYTDYQEYLKANKNQAYTPKDVEIDLKLEEPVKAKNKLSFKEKQELENLDKEIERLEKEKLALVEKLNGGTSDYEVIQSVGNELKTIEETLETYTLRWLELNEKE